MGDVLKARNLSKGERDKDGFYWSFKLYQTNEREDESIYVEPRTAQLTHAPLPKVFTEYE
jgi:hypothetical protein